MQTLTGSGVTGSTITGLNANATWDLGAGANDSYTQVGSGQTLAFSGFFNLTGGSGADDFVFTDGVTVNGVIDGGAGANTLDFSADTTAQNVTLTGLGGTDGFAGTEAAVSGGFTNINAIIGSATASPQTLTGANLNAVWSIAASGADSYTVGANTLAFTNYQNLTGGTGNDQFVFANGATFGGVLDGGAGVNTLNLSAYTTATKAALTGLGGMGGYVGTVSGITGFTDMQTLIGSATAGSTLTGLNAAAVWSLGTAGSDAYTKLGSGQTLAFSGFFNLTGGTGADAFVFATGSDGRRRHRRRRRREHARLLGRRDGSERHADRPGRHGRIRRDAGRHRRRLHRYHGHHRQHRGDRADVDGDERQRRLDHRRRRGRRLHRRRQQPRLLQLPQSHRRRGRRRLRRRRRGERSPASSTAAAAATRSPGRTRTTPGTSREPTPATSSP